MILNQIFFFDMRIFIFMGLPYQGKTTAATELYRQLKYESIYKDREIGFISTDDCRGKILEDEYPNEDRYKYTAIQECQSWRLFLGEIVDFMSLSPPNSILILDGTFTQWSKICEVLDILTLNIETYANQRLPLIVEFIHIGSQFGENLWKPVPAMLEANSKVQAIWNMRCQLNESRGLMAKVPDEVFDRKVEELRETSKTLISTCKCFMKSYRGLLFIAIHYLRHHPRAREIQKLI